MDASGVEVRGTLNWLSGTARRSEELLETRWDLDVDDPRWETRLPDPLVEGDWFRSQPRPTRSRYCLARTGAGLATGIAMETILAVALNRYIECRHLATDENRWIREELREESRHTEMFRRFLGRVKDSRLELPSLEPDPRLVGLAWERWLEAAVRTPELLFTLLLCAELPIITLQNWYLEADRVHQQPLLRSLYEAHLEDEVRHVSYAQEALARHLQAVDRPRGNRVRYLAPVAAARVAQLLVWPAQNVVDAFKVPDAALVDSQAARSGRELVSRALDPLFCRLLELGVISERTAPLWQTVRMPSQAGARRGSADSKPWGECRDD